MPDPAFDLWRQHSQNSRAIDATYIIVARSAKESLRNGDKLGHELGARVATLLLAAYMESRLNEIVWHYSGVTERFKVELAQLSVENRWRELVKLGFANRRNLDPRAIPGQLQFTDRARYDKVLAIVDTRVVELVQARNGLAHGQWIFAFRKDGLGIDQQRMQSVARFTLWRVTLERNLLTHLCSAVLDLVVTRSAHERDFDKHVHNLESANGRIRKGGQRKWESALIQRHRRRPRSEQ